MAGFWKRAALGAALWAGVIPAQAQTTASGPADYGVDANWLCRPGRADACAQDETATVISADGHLTREAHTPATDPPIDCFYVYPTVSRDPGGNSDLIPGPEERFVVQGQFARFAARCRPFAPMYHQVTLTALHARMTGATSPVPDRALAYNDVLAAWRHYLTHDNNGRGVVLIGHSQGSAVLMQLVKSEIDGQPAQGRLVSAILLGANVVVPDGADVGGTFKHIPACRAVEQTGCVISYVSFRDTAPPPAGGAFGRAMDPLSPQVAAHAHALCTNPANLAGGAGTLRSYFPADFGAWAPTGFSWIQTGQKIDTPFVTTPGLLSGRCVTDGPVTYLAIHVNAAADDVRVHDIPGDVIVDGRLFPDWGLHRIDMHETIGDLVDIVGRQGAAYAAAHPSR
ncbi:DUF3089 domain-containing protein [Azospirillum sp. B4]|uniref:DUF3089 domain-containing protein n=1 Tax=Azospirillum sp. B4 TaxID=95605 RepID=UPI00034D6128|nr:DUF3089 domain-containing protein [Azospirillum sp. B4]